jgi:hypothetical protein
MKNRRTEEERERGEYLRDIHNRKRQLKEGD